MAFELSIFEIHAIQNLFISRPLRRIPGAHDENPVKKIKKFTDRIVAVFF